MSTTRMCDSPNHVGDKLSRIFSELDDGWGTGSFRMQIRNKETGKMEMRDVDQDQCQSCTDRQTGRKSERPFYDNPGPAMLGLSDEYIAHLEAENARLDAIIQKIRDGE